MKNLTASEYFLNFYDNSSEYSKLIRAVRVDSPNSNWVKKGESGSNYTVMVIIAIFRTEKKKYYIGEFRVYNYEDDGETIKKDSNGKYLTIGSVFADENFSKKELDAFELDSSAQLDKINLYIKNQMIDDGVWTIIQDPWNPNESVNYIPSENQNEQPITEQPVTEQPVTEQPDNGSPSLNTTPIDPTSISGKITINVKSGPGVLIGINEVDIVNGKVDFSGIQFDQEGDYVLSITSTSPEIEPTEIKIKVNPEPEVIPQEPSETPEEEVSGTRPIIAQIDPPKINLPSMVHSTEGANSMDTIRVAQTIGNLPFFNYNGSVINDRDIQQLRLYHDGIIPKVKIIFRDSNNFISQNPPKDDTKFEIFIKSGSDNLKPIHLKFKVEDHSRLQNNLYTITGTIDISKLYRMNYKVYKGTSFNAIREICKKLELGFNSNIDNTDDEMPWRNIGDRPYKFISDIIEHSYISDESFMAGYIDFYYCFNYVDIEKEMKRNISGDVGIETGTFDDPKVKDTDKISKMRLISEKGQQTSCFYFMKTGQKNDSTKISMQQGYKTRTKFYDKVKKMFLVFDVDSTTSDGENSIILKGVADDEESFNNNFVTKYAGKIDTDNVHKNYNYAVTQNRINLDNMMKNQMDIKLPNPNFNIYKYQKIDVTIVKEAASIGSDETIEWRYSGEWLILDIVFDYSNGKLSQEVKLVRKEMGKNPDEMKNDTVQPKPETKNEVNENPILGTASETITNKPNQVYKVDETYTVQDLNGKKYIITIKKLSENGTDVVGEIRDIDYVVKQNDSISGVTFSTIN